MAVVDVLRPASVVTNTGGYFSGTIDSGGNCAAVTAAGSIPAYLADDDDETVVSADPGPSTLSLALDSHTPPANHLRHRIKVRARWSYPIASSSQPATVSARTSGNTEIVSYSFAGASAGGTVCHWFDNESGWANAFPVGGTEVFRWRLVREQTPGARPTEAFVDVDCRAAPTFTLDVLDGDMVSADPIVLSNEPFVELGGLDLDDLPGRTWQIALYTLMQTTAPGFVAFTTTPIWQTSGTGAPAVTHQTDPLANGDYVVYAQVVSTVAADTPHPSDIESYGFEVDVPAPPAPDVSDTIIDQTVQLCVDQGTPGEGDGEWDDTWQVRIRRIDCANPAPGLLVHVSPQVDEEYCWTDCYAPTTDPGCDEAECEVSYRVTLRGLMNGFEITTEATDTDPIIIPTAHTDRLIGVDCDITAFCTVDRSWTRVRPSQVWQPATGGYPTVTAGNPGGRNWRLNIGVTKANLPALETLLGQLVFFYSPIHGPGEWLAPIAETVTPVTADGLTYAVDTVAVRLPVI